MTWRGSGGSRESCCSSTFRDIRLASLYGIAMRRACAAAAAVGMVLVCAPAIWAPAARAADEPAPDRTWHVARALKRANIGSAIVLDARTGEVLGEKNADRMRPPASLMKMATALVVVARL